MPRSSFLKLKMCHEHKGTASTITNGVAIVPIKTNCLLNPIGIVSFNTGATFSAVTPALNTTGLPTWSTFYQKYYIYKTKVEFTLQNNTNSSVTMYITEDTLFNNPVFPLIGSSTAAHVDIRELPVTKMMILSGIGGPKDSGTLTKIFKTKKQVGDDSVTDTNWWGNVNPALSNPGFWMGLCGWWETGTYDTNNSTYSYQFSIRVTFYTKMFQRIFLTSNQ